MNRIFYGAVALLLLLLRSSGPVMMGGTMAM
jgi:hypothetical protein